MPKVSFEKSKKLRTRASLVTPHGVHSRARESITRDQLSGLPLNYPMYFTKAKGSHMIDVDGNDFVDYLCGMGSIILGHRDAVVQQAVRRQLMKAEMFGANSDTEIELSEMIKKHVPCAEQVIVTNAGTLADLLAIRLAKSHTRREKVVKFQDHYHGYLDWTFYDRMPPQEWQSKGISKHATEETVQLPWNDQPALEDFFSKQGNEVAAVICEPIDFNSCGMMPEPGFLESLRRLTKDYGTVLIFDEVITGFRLGAGGFQGKFGIVPDLATFAKAMGNGYPIAAITGKKEIMEAETFYGGTFNSHPVSVAASAAVISQLEEARTYEHIYKMGDKLIHGIRDAIEDVGVGAIVQGMEPCFNIVFTDLQKIKNRKDIEASKTELNQKRSAIFFQEMVKREIFNLPEFGIRWHMNYAHTNDDITKTIEATEQSLRIVRKLTFPLETTA